MAKYTIDQLCERTGLPRRTIRFYVQEGIIAPPAGRGRGGFYNDTHLETLLRVRALQDKGLTLDAIKSMLSGGERPVPSMKSFEPAIEREVFAVYSLAPGIRLEVSRQAEERNPKLIKQLATMAAALSRKDLD